MKARFTTTLILAQLSLSVVGLLYITYLLYFPFKPITFLPGHLELVHKQIKRGDPILYYSKSIRNIAVPFEVNAALNDGILINFAPVHGVQKVGERIFVNSNYTVPSFVSPGEYFLELTSSFKINPLRTIIIKTRTKSFEVIR